MDLTWFVDQGLQKDPARRYPSVQAMLDRLERRAEGDIPIQCHITFAQRASNALVRFANRHAMAMAGLAMMTVLALVVSLVGGGLAAVVALVSLAANLS